MMSRNRIWPCKSNENLLLGITEMLRAESLLGGKEWGGSDELLLISGGPYSDFSSNSMLMGPANIRVIARQPEKEFLPPRDDDPSTLQGEVPLGPPPPALQLDIQEWNGEKWTTIAHHMGTDLAESLRTLNSLQPESSSHETPVTPGCWAGGLAYDLVQWTQPWKLSHPPEEGAILMVLYRADRWLIHDRSSSTLHLVAEKNDDWANEVEDLLSILPVPLNVNCQLPENEVQMNTESSSHTSQEHAEIVEVVKDAIEDGELYQLNFGRRWYGNLAEQPWFTMMRLAEENPAPMSTWLFSEDLGLALCSCSPELLLASENNVIRTRPIKGTRPRGKDVLEDETLRNELLQSRKELAEHRMLVDLERNDIGIVSKPGSVEQSRFQIEAYSQVQHLVSEVRGELKEGEDVWNVLQAMFPGGSITGCPKTVTIAAIDELEKHPRSFWTGSIGVVDPRTGYSMWNILIRTLEGRLLNGEWNATIQAGGGLVMDSVPEQEVEEAEWKAQALRKAAGWITPIDGPLVSAPHSIHPLEVRGKPHVSRSSMGSIQYWKDVIETPQKRSRILFIDNLDSFSWNIMHAFCELGVEVIYCHGRLDGVADLEEIIACCNPSHIVIGPGPGIPQQSPISMELAIRALRGETVPLLGICLGHQAIGVAAGMTLSHCPSGAIHGSAVDIHHDSSDLFSGFSSPLKMARYNSLVILDDDESTLDKSAWDEHGNIMAFSHPIYAVHGVQFHPESCASILGMELLSTFISPPDGLQQKTRA